MRVSARSHLLWAVVLVSVSLNVYLILPSFARQPSRRGDKATHGAMTMAERSKGPVKAEFPIDMNEHYEMVDALIAGEADLESDPYGEGNILARGARNGRNGASDPDILHFDGADRQRKNRRAEKQRLASEQPREVHDSTRHHSLPERERDDIKPVMQSLEVKEPKAPPPVIEEEDDKVDDEPDYGEEMPPQQKVPEEKKDQRPLLEPKNADGSDRPNRMLVGVVTGGKKETVKTNRQAVLETWFDDNSYMVTHEEVETDRVMWLSDEAESGGHRGLPEKVKAMFA